jgi:hypothetical protein
MRRLSTAILTVLFVALFAGRANAEPLLQLDMRDGAYDPIDETIVAPGDSFSLFAILTPKKNASQAQITQLLNETYYISVALTPKTSHPQSLGSFEFGEQGGVSTTYDVTDDMMYGTPPLETVSWLLQGSDSGDLSKHGIFQTYFVEVGFKFSEANRTETYNTADTPGGATPNAAGKSYYAEFAGDTSNLAAGYNLHFDLYDTKIRNMLCVPDVDVDHFAPFSHDAATTTPVPEPGTGLLLLMGAVLVARFSRRRP